MLFVQLRIYSCISSFIVAPAQDTATTRIIESFAIFGDCLHVFTPTGVIAKLVDSIDTLAGCIATPVGSIDL